MEFTALQIAQLLSGQVDGNPDVKVSSVSKIEEGREGSISFLANPKYTHYIYTSNASIVIVNRDFSPDRPVKPVLIRVDDAYKAFAILLENYAKMTATGMGVSDKAFVSPSATIGKNCYIGDFAYIGENAVIGNHTRIYPHTYIGNDCLIGENNVIYQHVSVYHHTEIGNNCIFHSGAVIGSDGFGFAPGGDGTYKKIPQTGNVLIEDDVEVGANTTVDRATIGSTILRKGVKLDNLIQIAHNVEIGENTAIAAQTGISGSTRIGKNCQIGGQVGITGHLVIGDNVQIGAQSGVINNIKDGSRVIGGPAVDAMRFKKQVYVLSRLTDLYKNIEDLLRK